MWTNSAAVLLALLAGLGSACAVLGLLAIVRFAGSRPPASSRPAPITVLKPLCGPEPQLEAALASFCRQDHPEFQIVFGVQDPLDPAASVVRRLRVRFPALDIRLVVDTTPHGVNRKVSNLINMLPCARHDRLVVADSDLHVAPNYLRQVDAALGGPDVGLVTTLYVGQPVTPGWPARLGAMHLSHTFLPGALLARLMGRQDCLGSTMAFTRETLRRVGGLEALSGHLADDHVLGRLVGKLGLSIELAHTVPVTAVQERRIAELWSHELRWARTIRALAPLAYAASSVQYSLAWAMLAVLLSGGSSWAVLLLIGCWALRALVARGVDRALGRKIGQPVGTASVALLPVRDVLSVAEIAASFCGHRVVWKGHRMLADKGRPAPALWFGR